jgi:hypothetical protein
MQEYVIVDSSFSAIINAPLEQIDILSWCFSLPDDEYQGCSPAHFAAGSATARDGRRISINAEVICRMPSVQHYRASSCPLIHFDGLSALPILKASVYTAEVTVPR